tara:strand:- start:66 stop:299 length:234 start_codon:yes stop_codon:yes gene_type:complete
VEIALAILTVVPFSALCGAATWYLIRREERERRTWLKSLSEDYGHQWQEFDAKHKKGFEDDYWNTAVNKPEALEHGR